MFKKNMAWWKSFGNRWLKFFFYLDDDDDDDDDEDDEKKGGLEFQIPVFILFLFSFYFNRILKRV